MRRELDALRGALVGDRRAHFEGLRLGMLSPLGQELLRDVERRACVAMASPGRKAMATGGTFAPTLPPPPSKLPDNVEDLLGTMNRRERRKLQAKATQHASKRQARPKQPHAGALGAAGAHNPGGSGAIPGPATD
jgi:hypothetical protein